MESNIHRIIIGFCLLVAGGSLWGMYILSSDAAALPTRQSRSIATAETVVNEVKRKPTGSFNWFEVPTGGGLGYRDAIFVGDKGMTEIVLEDGSKLTISENSLLVLDTGSRDSQGQTSNVAELRLVRGDVAIQKAEGTRDLDVVVGKNKKIGIKSGSSIALGKKEGTVDLVVQKGKIKVQDIDVDVSEPTRFKDLNLEADAAEISKKIEEKEKLPEDTTQDSQSLLKLVPKRTQAAASEVESTGKLESFAKEVDLRNGETKVAALEPIPIPEAQVTPPEPAKVEAPPPPAPTKVIDTSANEAKVNVEIPPEVAANPKGMQMEMAFLKTFEDRFLKIPLDIEPGAKTYDVDFSYLMEVPGFKKSMAKQSNLYWRIIAPDGTPFPTKWVALRTPKTMALRVATDLTYGLIEGEARVPLRWGFKGVFVDKFYITLASDKNFRKIVCRVAIPNQNFVDPTTVEADEKDLRPFSYDLKSFPSCDIAGAAAKKQKLHLRVEPVDPDGKVVKADKGSKYIGVVNFK